MRKPDDTRTPADLDPECLPSGRSDGFSLVSAIFVLVVVASVAAALLNLVGTQRATSIQAVQGARAFHAGRSGIEWAAAKVVADPTACASAVIALGEGALNGFTVTVTCAMTSHVEAGITSNVFRLSANAEYASAVFGDPDYVSRRVQATVVAQP